MTRDDVVALVKRQAAAWENEDYQAITADFAPDGVFISPGGRWQGPTAIQQAAVAFFAEAHQVKVNIVRVLFDGQHSGAVEWGWTETRRADQQEYHAEDAIIFELNAAGQIIYWREYFDTAGMG